MDNPLFEALLAGRTRARGPALTLPDGRIVSHAELFTHASGWLSVLREAGARPNDRVLVMVEKSVAALTLYLACVQGGLVLVPINPDSTDAELDYFVDDAEPAVTVMDPERLRQLDADHRVHLHSVLCLDAQGGGSMAQAATRLDPHTSVCSRQNDDLAAMLYTSGTTGRPKGAMLTQRNLLENSRALASVWEMSEADVVLHALPLFHTHGLFVAAQLALISGASLYLLPRFEVESVLLAMPRCTVMMGVPTFYVRLLADPRWDRQSMEHMRLFTAGSAPLGVSTHREFAERSAHSIVERYGMTETGIITSNPLHGERRAGSVGQALPGVELRVVDRESGVALEATAEVGRLQLRGPNVCQGYWRSPEKSREALLDSGWFDTGDLAQIDADGYVTLVGRERDLIISGGYNIYPAEIEQLIHALPGVSDVAVVGIADADLGERVIAFVVPEAGSTTDLAQLQGHWRNRLSRYKQPREVVFCETLPRNTMGKVLKTHLREQYGDDQQ